MTGSFFRDRIMEKESVFRYKHHYILNAMDSEILYELVTAIGEKCYAILTYERQKLTVLPMKIYISTQTGRQHLLAWTPWNEKFSFFRLDRINAVKVGEKAFFPDNINEMMMGFQSHAWGVASGGSSSLHHLEMTVYVNAKEGFIVERLKREKRCGTVEQLDKSHWMYQADVFDALELLPWIRTFTGRITDFSCSDSSVTERLFGDYVQMAALYGGETDGFS